MKCGRRVSDAFQLHKDAFSKPFQFTLVHIVYACIRDTENWLQSVVVSQYLRTSAKCTLPAYFAKRIAGVQWRSDSAKGYLCHNQPYLSCHYASIAFKHQEEHQRMMKSPQYNNSDGTQTFQINHSNAPSTCLPPPHCCICFCNAQSSLRYSMAFH